MHMSLPKMKKDIYWDDSAAQPPYTLAAADYCIPSFLGSTIQMGLSGSDFIGGEEWLWDDEKHGPRRSVIRRVKRFLSVHEHPTSPVRRNYGRQSSDSSMFFPTSDLSHISGLLDIPPRNRHRPPRTKKKPDPGGSSPKLHASMGDLSVIRETSRTSTLMSLTPQSSVSASPTKATLQIPEVLITSPDVSTPTSLDSYQPSPEPSPQPSTSDSLLSGAQPIGTEQPASPDHSNLPPSQTTQTISPEAEAQILEFAFENSAEDKYPKRWSLPGFLESSQASLSGLSSDPVVPETILLIDTETSSQSSGINFVAAPQTPPDVHYLLEHVDTKETDITDFNNEQPEAFPKGPSKSSGIWF